MISLESRNELRRKRRIPYRRLLYCHSSLPQTKRAFLEQVIWDLEDIVGDITDTCMPSLFALIVHVQVIVVTEESSDAKPKAASRNEQFTNLMKRSVERGSEEVPISYCPQDHSGFV